MSCVAILLAAGSGSRFAHPCPKVFHHLHGRPVWRHSADALRLAGADRVLLVVAADHRALLPAVLPSWITVTEGGATRQASVYNALAVLENTPPAMVLIHDAARPLLPVGLTERLLERLGRNDVDGVIAAVPLADTLKKAGDNGIVASTVPRDGLWQAQTPQVFRWSALWQAHRQAQAEQWQGITDDAGMVERHGGSIALLPSCPSNIKITTPADWTLAQRLLPDTGSATTPVFRTGMGVDVHALVAGDGVILGGVKIPGAWRLEGHSDADVLLHALTDAILGAIGAGDIGQHFPPSEARWKGADSSLFVRHALMLAAAKGFMLVHADLTILGEHPRIAPHRVLIQEAVARLVHLSADAVAIKATTTEKLGFLGRQEGLAAMAVVTVSGFGNGR